MTTEKFNQLSLDKKFSFIRESLNKRACGFVNEMVFADMSISFLFGANGKPAYAIAEDLPKEFRERTNKLLKRTMQSCIITIWDNDPAYAKKLLEAKVSNSKN